MVVVQFVLDRILHNVLQLRKIKSDDEEKGFKNMIFQHNIQCVRRTSYVTELCVNRYIASQFSVSDLSRLVIIKVTGMRSEF